MATVMQSGPCCLASNRKSQAFLPPPTSAHPMPRPASGATHFHTHGLAVGRAPRRARNTQQQLNANPQKACSASSPHRFSHVRWREETMPVAGGRRQRSSQHPCLFRLLSIVYTLLPNLDEDFRFSTKESSGSPGNQSFPWCPGEPQ